MRYINLILASNIRHEWYFIDVELILRMNIWGYDIGFRVWVAFKIAVLGENYSTVVYGKCNKWNLNFQMILDINVFTTTSQKYALSMRGGGGDPKWGTPTYFSRKNKKIWNVFAFDQGKCDQGYS